MTATYTPPSVANDGCAISYEPASFGRTGPGMRFASMRREFFFDDAAGGAIDAPAWIPRGSLQSTRHEHEGALGVAPWHYVCATVCRA